MPMPNLDPSFALGKRLSGMDERIRSMETKVPQFAVDTDIVNTDGFAVGTSWTSLNPAVVPVPNGYTQCLMQATCQIQASCQPPSGTSNDWMAARLYAATGAEFAYTGWISSYGTSNGSGGNTWPLPWASQFPSLTWIFTGLVGGANVTITPQVYSGTGWTANASNVCILNTSFLFLP